MNVKEYIEEIFRLHTHKVYVVRQTRRLTNIYETSSQALVHKTKYELRKEISSTGTYHHNNQLIWFSSCYSTDPKYQITPERLIKLSLEQS